MNRCIDLYIYTLESMDDLPPLPPSLQVGGARGVGDSNERGTPAQELAIAAIPGRPASPPAELAGWSLESRGGDRLAVVDLWVLTSGGGHF